MAFRLIFAPFGSAHGISFRIVSERPTQARLLRYLN
jgi:hypothetical protein